MQCWHIGPKTCLPVVAGSTDGESIIAVTKFLRFLISKHPILALLFAISLAGLVWFGVGIVRDAIYFGDPAHQEQDLEAWMSPRYVGRSWDLPPEAIDSVMELEPDQERATLREVTSRMGISLEELQSRIETAKADQERHRQQNRPSRPDSAAQQSSQRQDNSGRD